MNENKYLPQKIIEKLMPYLGDVMFITLGGSHLTETEDENSDKDFIAVVKNRKGLDYCQLMFSLPNEDSTHHCTLFIDTVQECYDAQAMDPYLKPISLHFYKIKRDEILYENILYKEEIDNLFEKKYDISKAAAIQVLKNQTPLVNQLLENYRYKKWHYHLFFAYEILSGEQIPRNLLKDMKRGRNDDACMEYLKKISNWLKENKEKI